VRDQISCSHKNTENMFRNWTDFSHFIPCKRVDTWSHSSTKICNYPAISSNENSLWSQNTSLFGYSLRSVLVQKMLKLFSNMYINTSFKNIYRCVNAGI
jgi:hypothetical protein